MRLRCSQLPSGERALMRNKRHGTCPLRSRNSCLKLMDPRCPRWLRTRMRMRKSVGEKASASCRCFGPSAAGGAGGATVGVDVVEEASIPATEITSGVLDALRQQASRHHSAEAQSSLIRTDLKGPATFGAMASAIAECAAVPGQTSSTAEMLRKLAASLARLDAANKAAADLFVGDEV